jgi:integrase
MVLILPAMALTLYRRHKRYNNCKGGHPPDSRTVEFEERRKGWKRCDCLIFVSGIFPGSKKSRRKCTNEWEWDKAKAAVASWQGEPVPPPTPTPTPEKESPPPDITIKTAIEAYLANRGNREIAHSTMRKYRTFTKQLLAYAEDKGYVNMKQLGPLQMDEFYGSWKDGIRAKAKKLERLRGFLKFCLKRHFVTENAAEDLEAPVGASTPASKMPLLDNELTRIYEICDKLPTVKWKSGSRSGEWNGEDVKTFIMLLAWTGFRISDGGLFDMSKVTPHPDGGANIVIRMIKTGKFKAVPLYSWIDDWLYERMLEREKKFGSRIFLTGESTRLETVTDLWRRKVNKIFDLAGPFECGKPTPHLFRHTFVRLLLECEVQVKDVAQLIGDTEEMVRLHYARWVPGRQDLLTDILRNKLASAPKPKLAVIAVAVFSWIAAVSGRKASIS